MPIFQRHGVQVYLAGHDHNLQHIRNATEPNDIDYVISGGGGRGLYEYDAGNAQALNEMGMTVEYFGYLYGFTSLHFNHEQLHVQHVDIDGNVVYSFTRSVSTEPVFHSRR